MYRRYVVQLCITEQTEYDETFVKNRMHRILKLELELEQTKRLYIVQCSNEITITIINMG